MNDRKVNPQVLFERIKTLIPKDATTENYADIESSKKPRPKDDTKENYYEKFMLAMQFQNGNSSQDIIATFNQKSLEKQEETIKLANILRRQLLEVKDSEDVYNALLWLAYYFPLNQVNADNKLECHFSNEVIDTQNRFVASNGFQYSKNYLFNNKEIAAKQLLEKDLEHLEWVTPVIKERPFNKEERNGSSPLFTTMFFGILFGGLGGGIGTLAWAGTFGVAMLGALGGIIIGITAAATIYVAYYGIARWYDNAHPIIHERAEKILFEEPDEPLVKKELTNKSQLLSQSRTPSAPLAPTTSAPSASPAPLDPSASPLPVAYPPVRNFPSPLARQRPTSEQNAAEQNASSKSIRKK